METRAITFLYVAERIGMFIICSQRITWTGLWGKKAREWRDTLNKGRQIRQVKLLLLTNTYRALTMCQTLKYFTFENNNC